MSHSNAAHYERFRRLANLAVFAIALQCRRLAAVEPEDGTFVLRKWYDFEFLLLALIRLRRIAQQVASLPETAPVVGPAITAFEARRLPGLQRMRNVAEHIDEYSLGKGRDPSVVKEMLEVSTLDPDGPTLRWLETELDASQALAAGEALFRAIQEAGSGFPSA